MRKIFASILAIALVLSSFSMVAFAGDNTDIYFNENGKTEFDAFGQTTFTLSMYYKSTESVFDYNESLYVDGVSDVLKELTVGYSIENGSVSDANLLAFQTTAIPAKNDGFSGDVAIENLTNKSSFMLASSGYPLYDSSLEASDAFNAPIAMGNLVVTKGEADTTVITLSNATAVGAWNGGSYNVSCPSTITINWVEKVVEPEPEPEPAEDPIPVTGDTYTDKWGRVWTDVPTATYTKAVTGSTISGKVTLGYTKADEAKTADVVFAPVNGTFNGAEVSFTIAVIGVPEDVTINTITPAITVE